MTNRILSYVDHRYGKPNGDATVLAWPPVDPPAVGPAPPPPPAGTRGLITGLTPASGLGGHAVIDRRRRPHRRDRGDLRRHGRPPYLRRPRRRHRQRRRPGRRDAPASVSVTTPSGVLDQRRPLHRGPAADRDRVQPDHRARRHLGRRDRQRLHQRDRRLGRRRASTAFTVLSDTAAARHGPGRRHQRPRRWSTRSAAPRAAARSFTVATPAAGADRQRLLAEQRLARHGRHPDRDQPADDDRRLLRRRGLHLGDRDRDQRHGDRAGRRLRRPGRRSSPPAVARPAPRTSRSPPPCRRPRRRGHRGHPSHGVPSAPASP